MDVERELRSALTDERLSLPVRPDAVAMLSAGVRRRRRNRAVATVSAAVVLVAGGVTAVALATGGHGSQQQRIVEPVESATPTLPTKPTLPPPAQEEVRWTGDAYDYHHPPAFPGTVADPSVAWCRAGQLALSQSFQGATGSVAGVVVVTNTSPATCALQGQPAVHVEAANGATLVASVPEPFYVDEWVRLAAGTRASAEIVWSPEFCNEPAPTRITVGLPHAGGTLSTAFSGHPRCDTPSSGTWFGASWSAGRLDVGGFVSRTDGPFTSLAGLDARIDQADPSVAPGATLDYQLHLQSMDAPSVALNPCLPYRERLVAHATQRVLVEEDHLLNCGEAPEITDPQSNHDTVFDMQLVVPASAPAGDYDLLWQSVLKPVSAVDEQLVRVTPPVPACADGQVKAESGRDRGGAGGSYYERILFRNISTTTCSLFGYPGVKLADASGHAVKTLTQRGPATAHLIVLAPGALASATISGADFGPNGGATPCKPSAGVLVIAPGQHLQTLVRGAGMRCYDTVTVWPVVAGTRGSLGG